MSIARVVTITLVALPLAAHLAILDGGRVSAQSRFAQPRAQTGEIRFREMDRNNDGTITRDEWRGSDQSFRSHDWNEDGILSGDEVRRGGRRSRASRSNNVFDVPGSDRVSDWTENGFTGLDHNRDGRITTDEWHGNNFEAFYRADRNRDGALSRAEFLGGDMDDDREDRFEDLDMNRNGRVERAEWHGSSDAFQWLDRNNDGVLSHAEVVGDQAAPGAGAAVGTSGRQDCKSSAAEVVDDIYQQVLERSADAASAKLTQQLAAGQISVREIVSQLARSQEHAERFFWQPLVSTVYRQVLQREPTQQEVREAAQNLAAERRSLPEFIARTAARGANNDEGAVRILYRRLLGREADPEGLRGFTELARREGIEAVARQIVNSAEYRQRAGASGVPGDDAAAYEAAVRSVSRHLLGREPQALRELTNIAMTNNFGAVVDRVLRSPEYERQFGNDVVPGRNVRYCGPAR